MQKGRRAKNPGQHDGKGHHTAVHGDVIGACDKEFYRFDFVPKNKPGQTSLEAIEPLCENWIKEGSVLFADGAKAYLAAQKKHPDKIVYLVQLNHSKGEWIRWVRIETKRMKATTNKIDGAWAHLRRFFCNHMVKQSNSF